MTEPLVIKTVETALAESVQPRARAEGSHGGGMALLSFLAQGAGLVAPWWSKRRDSDLARFWPTCPHLAGAFYTLQAKLSSVPFRIEPRDASIKAHRAMAEQYQMVLEEESEFGQSWNELFGLFLIDMWSADNGGFLEVIGDGNKDGPIVGPALALAHLDSARCTRSGNPEYPVIYQAMDGNYYRLHRTRVIFRSQMPSAREEMNRVGYCWVSRIVDVAQNLVDIARYKQEKLGSRPQRGIIITKGGLDPDVLAEAFRTAEHLQDSRGLTRYSKFVVVGDPSYPEATLEMVDLASLPDGFDEETSTTLAMYAIALTGSVPARWLWPATASGATKADAMYQHVAGVSGGPGSTLAMIATAIGGSERGKSSVAGKFLPPTLKMVFDFQDDEQDKDQAEVRSVRSQTRERDVNTGVFSVRVVREQAMEAGDISTAQFEDMELADGRLPDGEPVLSLFMSRDGQMQGLLAVDAIGEPLDVANNDTAAWLAGIEKQVLLDTDIMVNAPNAPLKRKARQAIAALEALAVLYKPKPEPPPLKPEAIVVKPVEMAMPQDSEPAEGAIEEAKGIAGTGTYMRPAGISGLYFETPLHAQLYAEVDRLVSRIAATSPPESDLLRHALGDLLGNAAVLSQVDNLIAEIATANATQRLVLRQRLADLLVPIIGEHKGIAGTGSYMWPAGITGLHFETLAHSQLYVEVDRLVSRMAIAEPAERELLRHRLEVVLGNAEVFAEVDALIAEIATANPTQRLLLRQTLADLLVPVIAKDKIMPMEDQIDQPPFEKASASGDAAYGAAIRAAVRGLWSGALDRFAFIDSMIASITRRLTTAWHEGAAECGIKPDELSPEELAALHDMIGGQYQYIVGFADAVIVGSKANGGALAPLLSRAELWSGRYQEAFTRGKAAACGDKKAMWTIGPTYQSCRTCLKLNGKVKRWSTWNATILPGAYELECHGFRCMCSLNDTDVPMSKGPLPRIP